MEKFENNNPDKMSVRLTQTSKGFFYIDKIGADGATTFDCIENLKKLTEETIKLCNELNEKSK